MIVKYNYQNKKQMCDDKISWWSNHDHNHKVMMNTYDTLKFLQLEGDTKSLTSIGDSDRYC